MRPWVGKLLTVVGFVGGAIVALAVQMAMPSWFDPSEACERRFGPHIPGDLTSYRMDSHFFPPRATCGLASGVSHDYISTGQSTMLALLMVTSWLVFLAGLASLTTNWLRAADHTVPARRFLPNQLAVRTTLHLLAAAVLGLLVAAVAAQLLVGVLIFGESMVIGIWAMLTPAAVRVAARIDAALGGGRDGLRGSRRRGVVVGGLGSTIVLLGGVLAYLTDSLEVAPVGPSWIYLAAAVPSIVLAAVINGVYRTRRRHQNPLIMASGRSRDTISR